MIDHRPFLVSPDAPVREACRIIEENPVKIALVVDGKGRLLGTVTDGDVRRGLLKGVTLEDLVRRLMHARPVTASAGASQKQVSALMRRHQVAQVPLVNKRGIVAGVEVYADPGASPAADGTPVVVFAGGAGRRLMPLTEKVPKPMLPVNGRPLLEALLERVAAQGFRRVYLAVHYLEEVIKSHVGDGSRLGLEVRYLRETEPLGTAGALRLGRRELDRDFLVMNADLVTSLRLPHLLSFHREGKQKATLAAREYATRVPFGVLKMKGERVMDIVEKPASTHFVYAGVAALHPSLLRFIPKKGPFDMPDLLRAALAAGEAVSAFPLHEPWLDIGRPEDYRLAAGEADPGGSIA
jgi:dTDP-glucose pyrophosphorylase